LPDALGEGRFAADDFLREIQGLSAHFDVLRIDGVDYRHRGVPKAPPAMRPIEAVVAAWCNATPGATLDALTLCAPPGSRPPLEVRAARRGDPLVGLTGVRPIDRRRTWHCAFVVLVDRLYDNDVPVAAAGESLGHVFAPEMLKGGYRKKYFRSLSRLAALAEMTRT
jgi:cell division protein ZapE